MLVLSLLFCIVLCDYCFGYCMVCVSWFGICVFVWDAWFGWFLAYEWLGFVVCIGLLL